MDFFNESMILNNTADVLLEALPFLAFGFFVAGLLKSFVPNSFIAKHLGKENMFSPIKASLLGTPIPLCSCSVIPVATGLRRGGAGKGSLTSFLISAPETGVDSLLLSYAMLGPVMVIARIISALCTAIFTAWAVMFFSKDTPMRALEQEQKSCCGGGHSHSEIDIDTSSSIFSRFVDGQRYSFTTLLDSSFKWVFVALIATIVLKTYVSDDFLTEYGDGVLSMLVMVAVSFPLYICASASTPVAAGLLMVGLSPGSVMVFMLAGPASNIATIGVVNKLINKRSAIVYVMCVVMFSVLSGLILNWVVDIFNFDIRSQTNEQTLLHSAISIPVTILLLMSAIKPLRPYMGLVKRS